MFAAAKVHAAAAANFLQRKSFAVDRVRIVRIGRQGVGKCLAAEKLLGSHIQGDQIEAERLGRKILFPCFNSREGGGIRACHCGEGFLCQLPGLSQMPDAFSDEHLQRHCKVLLTDSTMAATCRLHHDSYVMSSIIEDVEECGHHFASSKFVGGGGILNGGGLIAPGGGGSVNYFAGRCAAAQVLLRSLTRAVPKNQPVTEPRPPGSGALRPCYPR